MRLSDSEPYLFLPRTTRPVVDVGHLVAPHSRSILSCVFCGENRHRSENPPVLLTSQAIGRDFVGLKLATTMALSPATERCDRGLHSVRPTIITYSPRITSGYWRSYFGNIMAASTVVLLRLYDHGRHSCSDVFPLLTSGYDRLRKRSVPPAHNMCSWSQKALNAYMRGSRGTDL